MAFQASNYIGTEFEWFGVDSGGNIGLFSSGWGIIPDAIFLDETAYDLSIEHFGGREPTCEARPSGYLQRLVKVKELTGRSEWLELASRGVFVYMEHNEGPIHFLMAVPTRPVHVDSLPNETGRYLPRTCTPNVLFGDTRRFDVAYHFGCGGRARLSERFWSLVDWYKYGFA